MKFCSVSNTDDVEVPEVPPTAEAVNSTTLNEGSLGQQNYLLEKRVYDGAEQGPSGQETDLLDQSDYDGAGQGPSGQENDLLDQSDYGIPLDRQKSLPTAMGDCSVIQCPTTPVRNVTKKLLQTPSPLSKRLRENDNLKSASRKYFN